MNEAAEIQQKLPFASEDWDALRTNFQDSIMAETNLCSLAQNAGMKWPIRGKEETPGKYINYTLEELSELPEFFGKGNRLPLLYSVLMETAQFDDPFADMVDQFGDVSEDGSEVRSNLVKMGIPMEYPIALTDFTNRTKDICLEGDHDTLDKLIMFLAESPTAVIMNEEFRQFLACLNSQDKAGLSQYIPMRHGSKGVYLAEALGQIARKLSPSDAATLLYAYRIVSNKTEWGEEGVHPKDKAQDLIDRLKKDIKPYYELMPNQANHLKSAIESGLSSSVRFFITLNDSEMEGLALAIAMASLDIDIKPRFKGLLGRFIH